MLYIWSHISLNCAILAAILYVLTLIDSDNLLAFVVSLAFSTIISYAFNLFLSLILIQKMFLENEKVFIRRNKLTNLFFG